MTQDEISALLGRPLTSLEVSNFDLYLEIANESLEELLCLTIDSQDESGEQIAYEQTFDIREGYSTVFTGIFTEVTEVVVDGNATTEYYPAFWDKRNGPYYNSIVLENCNAKEVTITASWGFDELPSDLQLLLAQNFANVSKRYKPGAGNVKRKDVRNFNITYGDLSDDEVFIKDNQRTIKKYSLCNIGYVRHGKTCHTHGVISCGCV